MGVSSQSDAWWTLAHKQKRYSAHIDPSEVLVHCKLTQVHMPRGSTIKSDTLYGVTCQLPLLREEFGIATLTFHSDLRRRAASRRALPCPSSFTCDRWRYVCTLRVLMMRMFVRCSCIRWLYRGSSRCCRTLVNTCFRQQSLPRLGPFTWPCWWRSTATCRSAGRTTHLVDAASRRQGCTCSPSPFCPSSTTCLASSSLTSHNARSVRRYVIKWLKS